MSRGRLRALPDSTTDDPLEVAPELNDEPVANASEDLDTGDAVITGIVVELEATFDEEEVLIGRVGGEVNCDLGDTLMAEKGMWEDCGNRAFTFCRTAATFAPPCEPAANPVYEDVIVA